MSIGSNLKALRKQRNMTQKELAHRTQITQGQLSEYENDKIDTIPIERLARIAGALRVSVAEIDERLLNIPGITVSGGVQNLVAGGTVSGSFNNTYNGNVNGGSTYNAGGNENTGSDNTDSNGNQNSCQSPSGNPKAYRSPLEEEFFNTIIDFILTMDEIDSDTKIKMYQKLKELHARVRAERGLE